MPTTDRTSRLSKLSPTAREALQSRMRGGAGAARIPRRGADLPAALSFAQERLWFLHQWEPTSAAYNRVAAFRLRGLLDHAALERSVEAILLRHDALRATFTPHDGLPQLRIVDHVTGAYRLVEVAAEHRLDSAIRAEASRPFDLAGERLLRLTVFRIAADDHALLIVSHHIAADRWSDALLYEELGRLYASGGIAADAGLPSLPIEYRDFAGWQRQRLAGGALAREEAYWSNQLRGAPELLDLPTDRARAPEPRFSGATHHFAVDSTTVQRLRGIAQAERTTLFAALLAAFAGVIRRWTERDDFILGTPVAGRSRVECERLIGCFINTLALRLDLAGQLTYLDVLRSTRQTCLAALAHAELPFERVIEAAAPQRSVAYSPLVQVMFALQNTPQHAFELNGLTAERLPIDTSTAKLDLSLEATETPAGLTCSIEYSTELFDASTISGVAERWRMMLEAVSVDPHTDLSRVPLLTDADQRVLAGCQATVDSSPALPCIHHYLERQARRTPDSCALIAPDGELTYAALDGRATQLAQVLSREGAGPGTLVAVAVERSANLIVALIAVLKSGAAYLPLDRAYPDARLCELIAQAAPALVITDRALPSSFTQGAHRILNLEAIADEMARQPVAPGNVRVDPDALAYVLFTSGSSGAPKGVMMPHRPVCNRIEWLQQAYPLLPTDRVLQHTSIAFDVSVGEIFCTLAAGATLVVAEPGGHRDPAYLANLIAARRVTVIDVVPRMLQALLEQPVFDHGRGLRQVHCGAEVLPPELARQFLEGSSAILLNMYGPTEACVDVATWRCRNADDAGVVPIGFPMANVRIHILDGNQQLTPIGQPGEIHIGGVALARGYLNRPDLSAASFIANTVDPEFSPHLYRTGDIARRRRDGAIELIGRRDRQLKVRGMRIELAEIEATIRQLPGIADCALTVVSQPDADPAVVAYLETAEPNTLDAARVRAELATRIPENMIPAGIVLMSQLPRTPGGKVDTAMLPACTFARASDAPPFVPPGSKDEHALAAIFADVLRIPAGARVGVTDDFFALGGHSLAAARVIARVQESLGVTLPLRVLFAAPTVQGLARALHAADPEKAAAGVPQFASVLHADGKRTPFFFLHAATEGDGFYSEQLGRLLGPDQPFYGLAPLGVDGSAIPDSVEEIAARYRIFIQECQPDGPYYVGGFCVSGPVAFEIARQLRAAGERVALVVAIESWIRNVGWRPRLTHRLLTALAPLCRLDTAARIDLFLRLCGVVGWAVPEPPSADAPLSERVRQHYHRATCAYVPAPADFPVVHLRTADRHEPRWARLGSPFAEYVVPGEHETCVTDHLPALAAVLGRCLDGGPHPAPPARRRSPRRAGRRAFINPFRRAHD